MKIVKYWWKKNIFKKHEKHDLWIFVLPPWINFWAAKSFSRWTKLIDHEETSSKTRSECFSDSYSSLEFQFYKSSVFIAFLIFFEIYFFRQFYYLFMIVFPFFAIIWWFHVIMSQLESNILFGFHYDTYQNVDTSYSAVSNVGEKCIPEMTSTKLDSPFYWSTYPQWVWHTTRWTLIYFMSCLR